MTSAEDNTRSHPATPPEAQVAEGIQQGEIVIGRITGVDSSGVYVQHPKNPSQDSLRAISMVAIEATHMNREVGLLFNAGDINQPVIMGLIHSPVYAVLDATEAAKDPAAEKPARQVQVDGETQQITANEEMILSCGEASIRLRKDGRIIIRGTSITTRSTGKNRILGASVLLN